jgi:hypothetical protein
LEQIQAAWVARMPEPNGDRDLAAAIEHLLQKRILYADKGRYFTLALPTNPNL